MSLSLQPGLAFWSDLPSEVWETVLKHVQRPQRLNDCALVSQSFQKAAASATVGQQLHVQLDCDRKLACFQTWVKKYGQKLLNLTMHLVRNKNVLRLKLQDLTAPALQDLQLKGASLQLRASPTGPDTLHSCLQLTKLQLLTCILGLDATFADLTPGLQHLELECYIDSKVTVTKDALQRLTCLTALKLTSGRTASGAILFEAAAVQNLSCLQKLQQLKLVCCCCERQADVDQLQLGAAAAAAAEEFISLPELAALTSLNLFEGRITVQPALLARSTQLQILSLKDLQHDDAAALLGCVEGLTQLQQLCIKTNSDPHSRHPYVAFPPASPAYSALTASSAVQELDVGFNSFPEGVWQHMFPPRRVLHALRRFGSWGGSRTPISHADVSRITSCCPRLEHIELYVRPGVQLTVLTQLSSLTELHLYLHSPLDYPPIEAVQQTVGSVARLTQLRKLSVGTWHETDQAISSLAAVKQTLLPLTELRGLTHMVSRLQESAPWRDFDAQATSESRHPVWEQLQDYCVGDFSFDPSWGVFGSDYDDWSSSNNDDADSDDTGNDVDDGF